MSPCTLNTSVSGASNGCSHESVPVLTSTSAGLTCTRLWAPRGLGPPNLADEQVAHSAELLRDLLRRFVVCLYWAELADAMTASPGASSACREPRRSVHRRNTRRSNRRRSRRAVLQHVSRPTASVGALRDRHAKSTPTPMKKPSPRSAKPIGKRRPTRDGRRTGGDDGLRAGAPCCVERLPELTGRREAVRRYRRQRLADRGFGRSRNGWPHSSNGRRFAAPSSWRTTAWADGAGKWRLAGKHLVDTAPSEYTSVRASSVARPPPARGSCTPACRRPVPVRSRRSLLPSGIQRATDSEIGDQRLAVA